MQLMPMIQQKFWTKDGNNLPLSFGSITFYYHGTTDFAPTYQNNGGAENDNPLPLDINGECQVWLDPAISYDIILKDADGADVDTREAVQVGDGGGGGGDTYTVKVTALDSTPNTLNYKVTNENTGIRVSTIGSAGTNQALQIGVKLSTDPTNAASLDATGLFVSQGRQGPPGPAGVVGSVVDTDSVDLTLSGISGDVLQADVRISGVAGNGLSLNPDGLFATANPSVDDTATVNLTLTGGHLSADVNVSGTAGNAITLNADGVYAPTPAVATTTTSLIQTVEKANTTTITMPSAWTMYGYCDRMPYGGTFNSIDVISPNGLGGSGTGIRGFIGKVTSRTAGNYTATILARTDNYATNSTGLVNITLSNSATLLQGEEWCLILRVDKSASGDLLALVPSAGLSSSNYLSLGENTAGADPAVGGTITFYAGTPAMLPWVRALA